MNGKSLFLSILVCLLLSGCAPVVVKPGPDKDMGRLTAHAFVTDDGAQLPLTGWPVNNPKAVIIALHGFNDYRWFFHEPARFFQRRGIISYAYDQRGFGESPNTGLWAGSETYTGDLALFSRLIKKRHPDLPVYLLGESMGGAVIVACVTGPQPPDVDGIILAAPAVWGRETMPWYQSALLDVLSHTLPWMSLTGEGLKIMPSDNLDMLIALGKDPLVIKETRVDAIHGLVDLMGRALDSAPKLAVDTLLLYGEKDEIVPKRPTLQFLYGLTHSHQSVKTIAYYRKGYHMLLRDLHAPVLWRDIASWIESRTAPLPSGADEYAEQWLSRDPQSAFRHADATTVSRMSSRSNPRIRADND